MERQKSWLSLSHSSAVCAAAQKKSNYEAKKEQLASPQHEIETETNRTHNTQRRERREWT